MTRPAEIPATIPETGTPASISGRQPPQVLAMEVEPFEPMISETTRIEQGKSSSAG